MQIKRTSGYSMYSFIPSFIYSYKIKRLWLIWIRFMRKAFFPILLFASVLTMASPARAADDDGTHVSMLVTIFWGIVGNTFWTNGEDPLRICLSGDDPHSTTIRQSALELRHRVITLFRPEGAVGVCDVVYVSGTGMDEVGELSRLLADAPVLTIGDSERFCDMGGMFCLLPGSEESDGRSIGKVAMNETVVSRSALRINPQMLRLLKRNQER